MANFLSKYSGAQLEEAIRVTQNLATVASSGKYGDLTDKPIYYNTSAYWASQTTFVGNAGDIIIYSDYKTIGTGSSAKNVCGLKIADGNAFIVDKPFITSWVEEELASHIADAVAHITSAERTSWNNKVNVSDTVSDETLVITRS